MWALHRAKPLCILYRHPCRNPKPLPRGERLCMLGWLCFLQSLLAYTPGIRAGLYYWGYRPVQARTLAVSRTKSLHEAVTQMADDLYGGFAPATPFQNFLNVFRQSVKFFHSHDFCNTRRVFSQYLCDLTACTACCSQKSGR